ncbi:MAG: uracil-DNA glycosylase, partial [Pseudomonadota bacterium]
LGGIAHRAVIKALGGKQKDYNFGHAVSHQIDRFTLLDSYHCSRYNTNTGRLTTEMFDRVFAMARDRLGPDS